MEIGVQLYTLRDYCKTLDDFANTLNFTFRISRMINFQCIYI